MRVAKDYDLSRRRDLVNIQRRFTGAARVVNVGNVAMIRSEIVLRISVHVRTPCFHLIRHRLSNPVLRGPKGHINGPIGSVLLWTLDRHWMEAGHNINALAGANRRLVPI